MENILGIDSSLENDISSTDNIIEGLALDSTIGESTDAIPEYASQEQNLEVEDNKPKPDNFLSAINSAGQSVFQNRQADISKPTSYYNPETKERYKSDASIYHDHFNPQSDNEKVAYENWDKWDALSAGWGGFKDSFKTSFEEYFRYDRMAKALFNFDVDYLAPTEDELDIAAYEQHLNEIKNPIYYAPGTESDILTKGFLAETIANLGFTFGTISGVVAEQIGTKALETGLAFLTPETGGASAVLAGEIEAAADAKAIGAFGKIWKNMTTLFTSKALNSAELAAQEGHLTSNLLREGKAMSSVDDVLHTVSHTNNTVSNGVKYGTKFWDNALKVASKVPFAGELADAARIYRAGKGILTSKELFQLGIGGMRRSIGEWQLAASEASIEAGGIYKDHVDNLIDIYEEKNGGNSPIGQDLLDIKTQALKTSTVDFGTNVAILGIMNKIQWGNLFGKFKTESKLVKSIRNGLNNEARELGILTVKKAGKITNYQKNMLGAVGLFPKIASEYDKKVAAWAVGKDLLRGLTRVQVSEGIQENLQEMSAVGIRDYYSSIYNNNPSSWGKSFDVALESQLNKQGFKTFLSGALTGLLIGPAMNVAQQSMQSFDKNAKAHKAAVKQSIEHLNTYYASGNDNAILKEAIKQIKLQNMYNEGMIEGLTTEDKKQYNDNKDSALIQTIMHAKRTGTLGDLIEFTKGYSRFSEDEFKQAFSFTPQELGKQSVPEVLNGIADSIQEYSDIYDAYQNKYSLFMGVEELIKDPLAKQKFAVKRAALLDAISTAAFIHSKSLATVKRQASMRQNLGKYKSIGSSLNTAFSTLVSPEKMNDATFLLQDELKTLKSSLSPELSEGDRTRTLARIADKENELYLLSTIKALMFKTEEVSDSIDPSRKTRMFDTRDSSTLSEVFPLISELMSEYLQIKNKQAGIDVKIDNSEINDAMKDIYDYMALGQDYEEYVDAVNFLSNPDVFSKQLEKTTDARVAAHAKLLYNEFERLAEISSIGKKFKDDNKELLDQLLAFANSPAGTYENMQELQKIREALTAKAREIDEAVEKEATEKAETVAKETAEKEKKDNYNKISKAPLPLYTMLEDSESNPNLLQEIDDYMKMRYDEKQLEEFPFEEQDVKKRVVTRYYLDYDKNKIVLDKYTIPLIIPGTTEPINNISALYTYLYMLEESLYNKNKSAAVNTGNATTQQKTEQIDNEKSSLVNHVGNPVMLNGEKGVLQVENDAYVVKLDSGSTVVIANILKGETLTFDDINELSPAYESLDSETKSTLTPDSDPVVDTNHRGTVTISAKQQDQEKEELVELDHTLNVLHINGVAWTLIKDENGLVIRLDRTWREKKKNGKGTYLRHESMSSKKGRKGADYAARANVMLKLVMRKMPETTDELVAETNALDTAIAETQQLIATGGITSSDGASAMRAAKQKSDERLALYRLNKVKDEEIPDDILEIKAKFDHPFKRNQLSHDDLIKLFVWADDLVKKIKGDVVARLMVSHPVVWNAIAELTKDYINPINDKLNGKARKKQGSSKVTKRSVAQEKSTQRITEELNARTAKPSTGKPGDKSKSKRVVKKKEGPQTVKEAVQNVEAEFEKQVPTSSVLTATETESEDQIHELSVDTGVQRINTITPDKINMVMASVREVAPTVSSISGTKAEILNNRQEELERIKEMYDVLQDPEGYAQDVAELSDRYNVALGRELYIEMLSGKRVVDFTPAEQLILDNPDIMKRARESVDFGDIVSSNIKAMQPEVDRTPEIPTVPVDENPFTALMNNLSCKIK